MLEAHAFKCGQITCRLVYLKEGRNTAGKGLQDEEGRKEGKKKRELLSGNPQIRTCVFRDTTTSSLLRVFCFGLHRHRISPGCLRCCSYFKKQDSVLLSNYKLKVKHAVFVIKPITK
ncbi:hypothetical protein CEXT_258171 [Caerostris extrusa]|uniref:Uncharacterized protein n=1 Tax=Caerostris extrusa TaxID=172846 RepID=A0AAV4P2Y0_CAEEX|nr:hypothetical protein CEXT_258171 [Caerostris extrusa]